MPVRNALQKHVHVLIVVAVCLVSLLGNNVIKKVFTPISTPPNELHQT